MCKMVAAYPVMLAIKNQPVLVVGGGRIAKRKIQELLENGAEVTVVSPSLAEGLDPTVFTWIKGVFDEKIVHGFWLVFACTDDQEVNQKVVAACQKGQLVNDTSNQRNSNFFNMATIKTEDYLLGISTYGKNPSLSKKIKEKLMQYLAK
ncbi:bifunctional precorrin-2 dehydrogenase/sirohydrochlorin ferrochelatase [Vagococcus intermedius]|uniref:precorrin-2 dehydrogenase n=2 Tax=Vagococcus intermedius TaxID=2991418 RepID=A0AAF0CTR4_9ENTE|nr:bifunctional precorrin-2 dehydrogenase/sirohydrochlorin ferrochelatase [Vagococcus intermedius]WEG72726.1 bifunctional precorrin-2 dehydrogenase/sirohydrochlorin ferrochelatase [Vagococcus intermedius]